MTRRQRSDRASARTCWPDATCSSTRSGPAARARSGGPGTCAPAPGWPPRCWVATTASLLLRFVHEQSVRIVHPHVLAPIGWAAEDDVVVLAMAWSGAARSPTCSPSTARCPRRCVAGAARPDAARAGRRARRGRRAPRREARQPAARADRPGPAAPAARRLRRRGAARPGRRPVARAGRHRRLPGSRAGGGAPPHPGQDLYAAGVVGRRAAHRPPAGPAARRGRTVRSDRCWTR